MASNDVQTRGEIEQKGLPLMDQVSSIVDNEYTNSGVSVNYVNNWNLKDALRELIQNAVDAMISWMKKNGDEKTKKSDWKIIIQTHQHKKGKYRTFIFTWPKKNKELGRVTYDPDTEQIILENPGTINKFNLLLGGSGSSKQQNDPDIIGRFGEGMKLAALAILRPDQKPYKNYIKTQKRNLRMDTGGQRWLWKLQNDPNFNNEICLFYKMRNLTEKESKRIKPLYTYTRIQGVTMKQWNDSYKHYIFFCKTEETMQIKNISPGIKHKGSILLEDKMKGRFFVKDLHIHDYGSYVYEYKDNNQTAKNFRNADNASTYYGYNAEDVELNRDRKAIPNLWHKYDRCSCIAADVLNNMKTNLNLYPDAADELNEMWLIIYTSLKYERYEFHYLAKYCTKETCDRIWNEWVKDKMYFPQNENFDHKIMPSYSTHAVKIENFFLDNQLDRSFYEYVVLPWRLCDILYKSHYYEKWNQRFEKLIADCKDYELNDEEKKIKIKLVNRLKKVKK
eukprot:464000_1